MPIIGLGGNEPPKVLQGGGPVKRYKTEINGMETELQLTDEDAKARGLKPSDGVEAKQADEPAEAEVKQAEAPANKQAEAPANKQAEAPANKAATRTKRDDAVSKSMNAPKGDA